jgi:hypothetical protein
LAAMEAVGCASARSTMAMRSNCMVNLRGRLCHGSGPRRNRQRLAASDPARGRYPDERQCRKCSLAVAVTAVTKSDFAFV